MLELRSGRSRLTLELRAGMIVATLYDTPRVGTYRHQLQIVRGGNPARPHEEELERRRLPTFQALKKYLKAEGLTVTPEELRQAEALYEPHSTHRAS